MEEEVKPLPEKKEGVELIVKPILSEALYALTLFFRPWKAVREMVNTVKETVDELKTKKPDAQHQSQRSAPSPE